MNVLKEFLKIKQLSQFVTDAVIAMNYDTKGGGSDLTDLSITLAKTQKLLSISPIKNIHKAITSGFLAPYFNNLMAMEKMVKPLFNTVNNDNFC